MERPTIPQFPSLYKATAPYFPPDPNMLLRTPLRPVIDCKTRLPPASSQPQLLNRKFCQRLIPLRNKDYQEITLPQLTPQKLRVL